MCVMRAGWCERLFPHREEGERSGYSDGRWHIRPPDCFWSGMYTPGVRTVPVRSDFSRFNQIFLASGLKEHPFPHLPRDDERRGQTASTRARRVDRFRREYRTDFGQGPLVLGVTLRVLRHQPTPARPSRRSATGLVHCHRSVNKVLGEAFIDVAGDAGLLDGVGEWGDHGGFVGASPADVPGVR